MRFGGFSFGSWHESESHGEVLAQLVELAVQSDRLGLDSFWLGEHHFSRHGILADTMVMAAHIAARTERIRIGTAVIVLPLHNPVRVAEQVAIVDHLSGGRVDVGVGIGYQQREFAGLGVDIDEARARFIESLDVMVRAWTEEPLVYEGEHVRIAAEDAITVYPKPLQQPHPPIYQAVSTTPASIDLAASRGLPVIVGGPTDVLGRAPEVIAHWRERMRAHGRDPEGHDLPCLQNVFVAESDEAAHAELERIDASWSLRVLRQVGSPIGRDGKVPEGYEHWVQRWQQRELASGEAARTDVPQLFGSPDTVAQAGAGAARSGRRAHLRALHHPRRPLRAGPALARAVRDGGRAALPRGPAGAATRRGRGRGGARLATPGRRGRPRCVTWSPEARASSARTSCATC